jgi:hypothetical protein
VLRRVAAWTLWWIGCWWSLQLLAGDWNRIEWIGGACVATVAATIAELVRRAAGLETRPSLAPLRHLPSALAMVLVDFGLLVAALVRRRPGAYVARETEAGRDEQAAIVLVAGLSPNAYVVDFDAERRTVLLHDVVPNRGSERPA